MKKTLIVSFGIGIAVIIILIAGFQYVLHAKTEEDISRKVDQISHVESLHYETLKVGLFGTRFVLSKVSLKIKEVNDIVQADKVSVSEIKTSNGHVLGFNLNIEGVGIPVKGVFSHEAHPPFEMPDPDRLLLNVGFIYQYNPDLRVLTLDNIKISSPDLADLDANIRLTNVEVSTLVSDNPLGLIPQLMGISISEAGLTYHDRSFLRTILADQNRVGTSEYRGPLEVFSENVNQLLLDEKDENTRVALENVLRFLNNPDKIHMTLSPEKPVPLIRFLWVRHLKEVVELLNLKIET